MTKHEHPLLSYRELISELKQLISERASGVMFISTNDNHAVHIGLENGEIVGCRYRFKRGLDALPLIMEIEAGRYSFNSGPSGAADASLPPTDGLLRMLAESNMSKPTDKPIQGVSEISAAPSIIAMELAHYLGPIASVIIEDYLEEVGTVRDSSALHKMIKSVASEITDDRKRDEFTESVLSKL